MRELIISTRVSLDIDSASMFYDLQDPGAGGLFADSIVADIHSLRQFAGIHRKSRRFFKMQATKFPFASYYFLDEQTIRVLAVLDARRDPEWIRNQLRDR